MTRPSIRLVKQTLAFFALFAFIGVMNVNAFMLIRCSGNGFKYVSFDGGMTWAQLVQSIAVQRAGGDVTAAGVCVALVSGAGSAPSAVDAAHSTAGSTAPCYVDNSADDGLRVQVSIARPDQIQIMVSTIDIQLVSRATARYET